MPTPIDSRLLATRRSSEKRFRVMAYGAIVLAGMFLVVFFADIIRQGYTAFLQAEILVDITYSQEVRDYPESALADDMADLTSRGVTRLLPGLIAENPRLMGTTERQWVLATAKATGQGGEPAGLGELGHGDA